MTNFFYSQKQKNTETVALSDIRTQVKSRLLQVHQSLNAKGSFNQSAKRGGGDSLLGSMIIGMLTGGTAMAALHQATGGLTHALDHTLDMLPAGFVSATLEAAAMLGEDAAPAKKLKVEGYPEGRRAAHWGSRKIGRSFNLVAQNDNEMDENAEAASLNEMLEMLTRLERQDVKKLALDPQKTVHQSLKAFKAA